MTQCGPGPAGVEGRGTELLVYLFSKSRLCPGPVPCCGVGKEACQLPEKRHCNSLCGLRSVPGVLSWLPTASWADPGCLGENEFSSHALGWADINWAFMNMKHGCWWAAYAGRWELRHSGVAHPIRISCPGKDRCCKLETSKERISVKPRAEELAVAKMDGGLIGISPSCQKSSLNSPGTA